jgi:O-antigen/teichoic acid export membrane protein
MIAYVTGLGAKLPSLLKLVVNQVGGRAILASMRFGIAILVSRQMGVETLGIYALVLSYILIAEWLVDFGQTDIAVKQLSARPDDREHLTASLWWLKWIQGLLVAMALSFMLIMQHQLPSLTSVGVLAGLSVLMYAGGQVFRIDLRARMRMDLDMAAEVTATFVLVLLVWGAASIDAGIDALIAGYALSRVLQFSMMWHWSRPPLMTSDLDRALKAAGKVLLEALPLGFVGLLAAIYESMDALALARWASHADVGIFTASNRLVMIAVMVIQAVSVVVYPLLAAQWVHDIVSFRRTLQATLDASIVFAGGVGCALYTAAGEIGHLFTKSDSAISETLGLLVWLVFARVTMVVLSQMVVVAGKQIYTVWLTGMVLLAKWIALAYLVPGGGAMGAVKASLITEFASLLPTLWLCQYVSGVKLSWQVPIRAMASAIVIVLLVEYIAPSRTILHGFMAFVVYLAVSAALGAIRSTDIETLRKCMIHRRGGH